LPRQETFSSSHTSGHLDYYKPVSRRKGQEQPFFWLETGMDLSQHP